MVNWEFRCYDAVGSTNDLCKELVVSDNAREGLVIMAESQKSGRGQKTSSWFSESGLGLYFSFVLTPSLPLSHFERFSVFVGAALCGFLNRRYPDIGFSVKEPNDILAGGKKLAGILVETVSKGANLSGIVTGIGLNLNHDSEDFPVELRNGATSIMQLTGKTTGRTEKQGIMQEFLSDFATRYKENYHAL
ncbi:MAG: biotin--[acetyl-CoA-carboxylase] ligase [Candidatus Wallbacteria bacterium]|nr:biotin--[acetyl-CoA-carboxylase] ligase [Candidatus Wallbacteria bacterium]